MATTSTPAQNDSGDNRGDYSLPPIVSRQGGTAIEYDADGVEVPR